MKGSTFLKGMINPLCWVTKVKRIMRDGIIRIQSKRYTDFFFVQIGANDGVRGDPIHKYITKYQWKGLLVEPQKEIFQRLKKNYQHHTNLFFENAAVACKNGYIDFYKSGRSFLSSIYPDSWFKARNKGEAYTKKMISGGSQLCKVKSITFSTLMKKFSIKRIDLLQIDTEGFDYEIIKQINFAKIMPRMIQYEDHHLADRMIKECRNYLRNLGYHTLKIGPDTFAYRK